MMEHYLPLYGYPSLRHAVRELEMDNNAPRGHFAEQVAEAVQYFDFDELELVATHAHTKPVTPAIAQVPGPQIEHYLPEQTVLEYIAAGGEHTEMQRFLTYYPEYKRLALFMDFIFGEGDYSKLEKRY